MSNLIEELIKMDELKQCDALIFQPIRKEGNGAPAYWNADAIIRRIRIPDGSYSWAFHTLMMGRTGSGTYGDMDDIVKAAERQFGIKSEVREWIPVEYVDPDFPVNLLPR